METGHPTNRLEKHGAFYKLPPPVTKRFSRATGTLRDLDTAGIPR
jgi:hypothetical protein